MTRYKFLNNSIFYGLVVDVIDTDHAHFWTGEIIEINNNYSPEKGGARCIGEKITFDPKVDNIDPFVTEKSELEDM